MFVIIVVLSVVWDIYVTDQPASPAPHKGPRRNLQTEAGLDSSGLHLIKRSSLPALHSVINWTRSLVEILFRWIFLFEGKKHVVSFYNVIIQGPDIKQIGECVNCQGVKIDFMIFFAGVSSLVQFLVSRIYLLCYQIVLLL